MIISVASGKGGTGKTTVATNLAYVLGGSAQLLDCDVEEPNAHVFLQPDISFTTPVYSMVPEVDSTRCTTCKKCAEICRFSAITIAGQSVLTFPELCHGCGGCVEACPEGAIAEGKREIGVVEEGRCGDLRFVQGRMRIGEAMAPPLIRSVRKRTNEELDTIIDAPPGTSCPVMAAMKGADFVILVTEPTPFGLYDLKLAVEAVRILGIPCGLVINRADLGNDDVRMYASREAIPVLMEIPFDRDIAEAYSHGRLLSDMDGDWSELFLGLQQKIEIFAIS